MSLTKRALDQALETARRLGAAREGEGRTARAFARLSADIDAAGVVLGPDSTDRLGCAMARLSQVTDRLNCRRPEHDSAMRACRALVLAFADGDQPARWGNWGKVLEAWHLACDALAPQEPQEID